MSKIGYGYGSEWHLLNEDEKQEWLLVEAKAHTKELKMKGCTCPVSQAQWQSNLDTMYAKLDINPHTPLTERVHHVFVSINPLCKNTACV